MCVGVGQRRKGDTFSRIQVLIVFFFNQTRLLMTRQNPTLADLVKIEFC